MCEHWSQGFCRVLCKRHEELVDCPGERAENAGEVCCHHPKEERRLRLLGKLQSEGVPLGKFASRIDSPSFVERLYRAWRKRTT